jgi:hypothetical protein
MKMKMNRTIAAIATLMAGTAAFAQIANPPRVPTPPGVLEGQSPPVEASTGPIPTPGPGTGRGDAVLTRNSTDAPMWVTVYQAGIIQKAGCVVPKGEMRWSLVPIPTGARIRAETTAGANCAQPVVCDTSIERRPGGAGALELSGKGSACGWKPIAVPRQEADVQEPKLRGVLDEGNLTTKNDTRMPMWVTVYDDNMWGRQILQSGCVQPGREGKWHTWPRPPGGPNSFYIRAEGTRGANCQQPVNCDTTMELLATKYINHKYHYYATFKANSQNCWWDHTLR